MKIAYVDCSAGAAGDMLLSALVDAGGSQEALRDALDGLGIGGWDLAFEETQRGGIRALQARIDIADDVTQRTYRDIVSLLRDARLPEAVRERALKTFDALARAEARVHGIDVADVHFHEAGALDAIVDVVGCCAALASLRIDRLIVSPIATGVGTITSAHGDIPLPAPAVTELLEEAGAPLFGRGTRELITPTGAAVLVAAADGFGTLPAMSLEATGYGAGTAELDFPNIVRVLVGTATSVESIDEAVVVETNIDDMSPELFPHVVDRLLAAGAQDAWVTPIVMKKGRPAFTLSVLCDPEREEDIAALIFAETTTLGTRTTRVDKRALQREWVETDVEGARVRVKIGRRNGDITTVAPEHDDAVAAADATGLPLKHVYARAIEQVTQRDGAG